MYGIFFIGIEELLGKEVVVFYTFVSVVSVFVFFCLLMSWDYFF